MALIDNPPGSYEAYRSDLLVQRYELIRRLKELRDKSYAPSKILNLLITSLSVFVKDEELMSRDELVNFHKSYSNEGWVAAYVELYVKLRVLRMNLQARGFPFNVESDLRKTIAELIKSSTNTPTPRTRNFFREYKQSLDSLYKLVIMIPRNYDEI